MSTWEKQIKQKPASRLTQTSWFWFAKWKPEIEIRLIFYGHPFSTFIANILEAFWTKLPKWIQTVFFLKNPEDSSGYFIFFLCPAITFCFQLEFMMKYSIFSAEVSKNIPVAFVLTVKPGSVWLMFFKKNSSLYA